MAIEERVGTDSPDVVEEDVDIQPSPPEQEPILFQATARRPTRSKMALVTKGGEEEKFPRPQESRVIIALDQQSGTGKHYSAKPGKMPRRFEGKHHDDYPKTSQKDPRLGEISFDAFRSLTTALKDGTSVTSWPTEASDADPSAKIPKPAGVLYSGPPDEDRPQIEKSDESFVLYSGSPTKNHPKIPR